MVLEVLCEEGDWELRFEMVDLCEPLRNDIGKFGVVLEVFYFLLHLKLYLYSSY